RRPHAVGGSDLDRGLGAAGPEHQGRDKPRGIPGSPEAGARGAARSEGVSLHLGLSSALARSHLEEDARWREQDPADRRLASHGEEATPTPPEKILTAAPTGKVSFLANQVKLFADGAIFSQLMQMKGGYTDGHKGEWIATPQEIRAATKLYWDSGYQLHIHVN